MRGRRAQPLRIPRPSKPAGTGCPWEQLPCLGRRNPRYHGHRHPWRIVCPFLCDLCQEDGAASRLCWARSQCESACSALPSSSTAVREPSGLESSDFTFLPLQKEAIKALVMANVLGTGPRAKRALDIFIVIEHFCFPVPTPFPTPTLHPLPPHSWLRQEERGWW